MELRCPNCRRPLHPDDVDLQTSIGKCGPCARVFHLYDQVRAAHEGGSTAPKPIPSESQLVVVERREQLTIRSVWSRRVAVAGGLTIVVLAAVSAWQWSWAILASPPASDEYALVAVVTGVLAFALLITVSVLALGFRRACRITRVGDRVILETFDRRDARRYDQPRSAIEQLYVVEDGTFYSVRLLTRERQTLTLLTRLSTSHSALFFERKIETFLGIEDRPVPGEAQISA